MLAFATAALHVAQMEICPWALREGIIFRRLDTVDASLRDTPADVRLRPLAARAG